MNAAQIAAISRHVATLLGGIVIGASLFHLISTDDARSISSSLVDISNGVASISAALGGLIAVVSGAWAMYKQAHTQQIRAVNSIEGLKVTNEDAPGDVVTVPPQK